MKKRVLVLLMAAAMLLPLAACAQSGEEIQETTASVQESIPDEVTTADPNDRSQVKDNVPEDLNFDGETIRVIMRGAPGGTGYVQLYDVEGTDNKGDYITDGVWYRNVLVEDRLDVTVDRQGITGSLSECATQFKALVMAGADEFDYIHTTGNTNVTHALNLYLRDLSDIPYVDYSADWWWEDVCQALSLDGSTYNYIFGDSLIYCYIQTGALFYNKDLYENAFGDPDEMYRIVMDGEWTIDKMVELTTSVYADLNGDGVENDGDIFGSIKTQTQVEEVPHLLHGCDLRLYTRDEEQNLIIDFDKERCITALEKLGAYNTATKGVYHSDQGLDNSTLYFTQGNILFLPSRLGQVLKADMRNMESPYGILPYPKLDVEQAEYLSLIHDSCTNLSVPKTVSDEKFEIIGAYFECTAAESWRSVMPLFLETALKMKYSRDSMSGQVIDILVNSVAKNTLFEYGSYTSNIFNSVLANSVKAGSNNFASSYSSYISGAQKSWDNTVEKLLEE